MTREPEHRRTALGMGRTFQITNVFAELTLLENLALAVLGTTGASGSCIAASMRFPEVRARPRRASRPSGSAGASSLPAKLLSYGERRQLELALALATRPRVLLLDEPCAGLSPSERQRIAR